ncbi:dTDP-glucose 4,6-dehydratase [Bradyrhizobium sp. SRS-191]|uniref:dTDP-glucose 4,6-dehydratase n=1 Tax=Bradyrhizobium sp. SRS-191 TaxID=2962606 RepID=UPI00211E7D83|nr:dTDP-glucose 4,6-dehydratase [Bradyrhizobium sp. SRS-191]
MAELGSRTILVTGGAGFIGANFILDWFATNDSPVVTLDKLTYAGNIKNLAALHGNPKHMFVRGDIGDVDLVQSLLARMRPSAIVNFAAESHVDRSIHGPGDFISTNIEGTFRLLECTKEYWLGLPAHEQESFRFLHISTDEVYGSLTPAGPPFSETDRYMPNSPYAASKAASDHLVRAWHHTYGLPTMITNCSNNYGPYQFPEKLIPLIIDRALKIQPLPIYGDGQHVRDWLYVGDHCRAIRLVLANSRPGETYNIGGNNERTNLDVVTTICTILDRIRPRPDTRSYAEQIQFVKDRPGHDRRYAIDADKIRRDLGWRPVETFEIGLEKTVDWYLNARDWVADVTSGAYRDWAQKHDE